MLKKQAHSDRRSFIKNLFFVCFSVTALMSLTGCLTFLTEIRLRGDGSGTMVQTMTMDPTQLNSIMDSIAKQMAAAMGGPAEEVKPDPKKDQKKKAQKAPEPAPFKEEELRNKAGDMGEGVKFVSMENIDTKYASGVRVTYAFKDINQLFINPKPQAALGTAAPGASSPDALKFRFKRQPDGNAVLTIVMPPPEPKEPKKKAETASPASPEESAEQMEMVKAIFKGLHMGISIDIDGKIVKTNSPYVEGSKVTLVDIDFDPLLADAENFKKLNEKMEAAEGDDLKKMEVLKGIKGIKIITAPETTIEFTPNK